MISRDSLGKRLVSTDLLTNVCAVGFPLGPSFR